MKQIVLLFIILMMTNGCQPKQEDALYKKATYSTERNSEVNLSQLMTDKVVITPLETCDESITGKINKIKKNRGHYYILSNDQWILHFDEKGKYVSTLNRQGGGPDEYSYIGDFDIYTIDGRDELWIADNQTIKIYNTTDWAFQKKLSFPLIVNKFKRVSEEEILIMSGQNENSLFIANTAGEIKHSFLEKEIPYLLFRAVQFKADQQASYYFQLGVSNKFVAYDADNHSFRYGSFLDSNDLLTADELKDLFDKHGQSFIAYFKDYDHIHSFMSAKGYTWFYIKSKGKNILTKVNQEQSVSAEIGPNTTIKNDLFDVDEFAFLTTLGFGESDEGLLLYLDPSALPDEVNQITTVKGETLPAGKEDNPLIIEFF